MTTLQGKTILVTGATDGIGRRTAHELAARGARVIVHGRSAEKIAATVAELPREGGMTHAGARADLAVMAEVRGLADDVKARFDRLDVLLHNAGVFMPRRVVTPDGFETTWAVNHLAPFLLTHLLTDLLVASAPARVITVASVAHNRGRIFWQDPNLAHGYEGYAAYAQSKLANVLFSNALAARHDPVVLASNSLHPGVINTKLLAAGFGRVGTDDVGSGAATSVRLASAPELAGVTGRYFSDEEETQPSLAARDKRAQAQLWELSERMLALAGKA